MATQKTSAVGMGFVNSAAGGTITAGTSQKTIDWRDDVVIDKQITAIHDVAATLTDVDTALPTSAAIIDYVAGVVADYTLAWSTVADDNQTAAVWNGYVCNSAADLQTWTLPATAALGDVIEFVGKGAGKFEVVPAAGDNIVCGGVVGAAAGGLVADTATCAVRLVCSVADTTWNADCTQGTFTLTV